MWSTESQILFYARALLIVVSAAVLPVIFKAFYRLRMHFVVSARNPMITLIISIIALFITLSSIILYYIQIQVSMITISPLIGSSFINIGFSYFIMGLLTFKLISIYFKWKATKLRYEYHHSITSGKDKTETTMKRELSKDQINSFQCGCIHSIPIKIYKKILFGMLIVSSVIMGICASLDSLNEYVYKIVYISLISKCVRMISWLSLLIITMIYVYKSRKIDQNLSCITEVYVGYAIVCVYEVFNEGLVYILSKDIIYLINTILWLSLSYYMMFTSFYIIKRVQGTIIPPKIDKISYSNPSINKTTETPKSLPKLSAVPTRSDDAKSRQTLKNYLSNSFENYDIFVDFLRKSFAVESILFYTRVIILRHRIWKIHQGICDTPPMIAPLFVSNLSGNSTKSSLHHMSFDLSNDSIVLFRHGFELSFDYLTEFYSKPLNIKEIKLEIEYIYETFIKSDGIHCINISYDARKELINYFNNSYYKLNTIITVDSITNYLKIYDSAARQVWKLMCNVYRYQFHIQSKS